MAAASASCSKNDPVHQEIKQKFNVIIIVSDALRQDIVGCYGGEAKTPNIDWLAKNGIRFDNAYSTSPWTVPSSVSMFTGNHPTIYKSAPFAKGNSTGIPNINMSMQIQVPDNELLLTEYLKQHNYLTGMKVENPHAKLHNNLQGFEPLAEIDDYNQVVPTETKDKIVKITGEKLNSSQPYIESYIFLSYLLKLKPTDNFFILDWMVDPHGPYQPIAKFKERITRDQITLPRVESFYNDTLPANTTFSEDEKWYNKQLYIAEVESVDERVGFIIKTLRENNLLNNTFIVFTSDHGEEFGEHGQYGHGGFGRGCNYYDTLVKVPLIISGPTLSKQQVVSQPVSHLDLMPTLKDMLDIQYTETMQGKSYYPLLTGESTKPRSVFFSDIRENSQIDALIQGNSKLIALRDGNFELYDLENDKKELKNLANTSEEVTAMKQTIVDLRDINKKRKEKNEKLPSAPIDQSSEEKKETIKKLKGLGYIK